MSQILLITSSPRGEASYSTKVARALADKLAYGSPNHKLVVRNLAHAPLPHIDETFAFARNAVPADRTPAQKAALIKSDELVAELLASDILVIGSAMINFGVSSNLKSYLDYIVRPGATFRYTDKGPEGLAKGKKTYIVTARGGVYSQGPMQAVNFQDTYLKGVLGFIGMTDIEVIPVEGVAFGPEAAEKALSGALTKVAAVQSLAA